MPEKGLCEVASGNNGFVAVGETGTIMTLANGVDWINRSNAGLTKDLYGVAYRTGGSFVAVGEAGTVLRSELGVIYNGNGNTGGSVPTDTAAYLAGDPATVLGNTGSLTKSGYTLAGWNTKALRSR